MTQTHNARHSDQRRRLAEAALEVVQASRYVIDASFQVWVVERREGQEFHNLRRVGDLVGMDISSGTSRFTIGPEGHTVATGVPPQPAPGVA